MKMHKNPYKHRFIAGSSRCSTKPLSILLTKLLTHIKQGLQKYCEISYSRSGVNQMWIQKNSKELLEHLQSPNFNHVTSIKSFDFSTLYTTIPHQKLKSRLATIIRNSFIHKNGNRRYKCLVLGRDLRGKGFPTDSRHSDGHKLCPSPSRHISVLVRSGIHTVFTLNWKEKISISVQIHIQIHR